MMTYDVLELEPDTAEATAETTTLSETTLADPADASATPVFSLPVLDRIRTSD